MKIPRITGDPEKDKREAEIAAAYDARSRVAAAAPDLLAALAAVLAVLDNDDLSNNETADEVRHLGPALRAAVAKAKGG